MFCTYTFAVSVLVVCVLSSTYNNCRLMPFDRKLYHRRIQQEPKRTLSTAVVRFPEILLDRTEVATGRVISCIRCIDLYKKSGSEASECKVIAGGVGYTFVKLKVTAMPHCGYDYDVWVFGH